jgi:hypothetical protein
VKTRVILPLILISMLLWGCAGERVAPAPVTGPPVQRPAVQAPPAAATLPTISWTIQVGAFTSAQRAARFNLLLESQGLDAFHFIDDDGLYKVRLEKFDSQSAARQRALALQDQELIQGFYIVSPAHPARLLDPRAELRRNLVETAHRFIGTPYRWGGQSIRKGFDCSGLTMTVYRLNGLDLPRHSTAQFQAGRPIERAALSMGDLVFFATGTRRRVSHVGIYIGHDHFIHAPGRGKTIRISSLSNTYFNDRYMGARRYF